MHPSYHPKQMARSGAHHQSVSPTPGPQFQGADMPNSADVIVRENDPEYHADPYEPEYSGQPNESFQRA